VNQNHNGYIYIMKCPVNSLGTAMP